MYKITKKQYNLANNLGIKIFPSEKKNYKIDIYDENGIYHTSIGDKRYNDYFIYLSNNKQIAEEHKRRYLLRHAKELYSIGSRGWFSAILLWNYKP